MTKRLFRILSAAFNSIKVRLKQRLRKQLNKVFDFQFHKGAIETFVQYLIYRTIFLSIP